MLNSEAGGGTSGENPRTGDVETLSLEAATVNVPTKNFSFGRKNKWCGDGDVDMEKATCWVNANGDWGVQVWYDYQAWPGDGYWWTIYFGHRSGDSFSSYDQGSHKTVFSNGERDTFTFYGHSNNLRANFWSVNAAQLGCAD